ncbi:MAG TPA: protein-L-isoaspartate O-methyltransferase [Ramlibacter sp.]|nr:protein-L-isoaspartate O-methyltransferase [Ramlibacter sp.]
MNAPANLEQARYKMIEQQIRPWNVRDAQVLELLSVVRREDFVPLAHKPLAFVDTKIALLAPVEAAMSKGQCMLEPKIEARLLQDLHVRPQDKVLEVGAGSGYMAALLAARAQRVVTLEINPELVQLARGNLKRAGVGNVEVREADGAKGLPSEAPFDVIVLSGSVAEVPPALLEQLKVGGRLAAIVGFDPVMRTTIVTRTGDTSYTTTQPWDTNAPRLANFPEPSKFHF